MVPSDVSRSGLLVRGYQETYYSKVVTLGLLGCALVLMAHFTALMDSLTSQDHHETPTLDQHEAHAQQDDQRFWVHAQQQVQNEPALIHLGLVAIGLFALSMLVIVKISSRPPPPPPPVATPIEDDKNIGVQKRWTLTDSIHRSLLAGGLNVDTEDDVQDASCEIEKRRTSFDSNHGSSSVATRLNSRIHELEAWNQEAEAQLNASSVASVEEAMRPASEEGATAEGTPKSNILNRANSSIVLNTKIQQLESRIHEMEALLRVSEEKAEAQAQLRTEAPKFVLKKTEMAIWEAGKVLHYSTPIPTCL